MRGETVSALPSVERLPFQFTPLIRGETLVAAGQNLPLTISIHSPHTRGDTCRGWPESTADHFNPLPSHEGRRLFVRVAPEHRLISICSPHARGDCNRGDLLSFLLISIHSPHARGDFAGHFQRAGAEISIHSPHARGDAVDRPRHKSQQDFNPLPSCEGRPGTHNSVAKSGDFNPLPSYEGRRRKRSHERWLDQQFQSTPLMRGETARWRQVPWTYCHFNPLPSCEGRRCWVPASAPSRHFNPLPSYEGRRRDERSCLIPTKRFQSTPLIRGETLCLTLL